MRTIVNGFCLGLALLVNTILPAQTSNEDCALPAPSNLESPTQTPTSLTLTWNPVAGAALYRVLVTEVATNLVVDTFYTDSNYVVVTGLLPATTYEVAVAASACLEQPDFGPPASLLRTTSIIIVDIIIQQNCPIPNTRERWQNGVAVFSLPTTGGQGVRLKANVSTLAGHYDFYLTANGPDLHVTPVDSLNWRCDNTGSVFTISNNGVPQLELRIRNATNSEVLAEVTSLHRNLNLYSSTCSTQRLGDRVPEAQPEPARVGVFPNPFNDVLNWAWTPAADGSEGSVVVQNSAGQVYFTQHHLTRPLQITTVHWPAGLYVVRTCSAGQWQVFKVIKSENQE